MLSSRAAVPLFALLCCGTAEADVDRGRALLAQYQCGTCHAIPGVPASRGEVAQPLAAWSQRSYIAGRVPNRIESLARWIVAPQSLVPGTTMPAMGVSPADAQAMAAYLFSLE
ncbi:cytochrome c [Ramlibacter terrae]|uniref:Cytochrome c n=1 Tax=Ramlibacter terrae TaxID=2732511 RepID=A0ABX6P263_9BURK|nr:cytochrome c [Ramlibacter terrae]